MNLQNEIDSVSGCAHNFALEDLESERNKEEVEPCLRKSDAIRIAKKYAKVFTKAELIAIDSLVGDEIARRLDCPIRYDAQTTEFFKALKKKLSDFIT